MRDERGGGYQTQAVPVQRKQEAAASAPAAAPAPAARRAAPVPAAAAADSRIDDAALEPETQPHTGTITVVEPAVTSVRETPKEMPRPIHRPVPPAERVVRRIRARRRWSRRPSTNQAAFMRGWLMRLGLILSEVGQGFRRNLSMVVSVVLVTFISLTFFGAAILLQSQITQTKGYWYDRAQVAIYLCTDISSESNCNETAATEAQKDAVQAELEGVDPRARTSRRSSSRITTRRTRTSSTSSRARPPRNW